MRKLPVIAIAFALLSFVQSQKVQASVINEADMSSVLTEQLTSVDALNTIGNGGITLAANIAAVDSSNVMTYLLIFAVLIFIPVLVYGIWVLRTARSTLNEYEYMNIFSLKKGYGSFFVAMLILTGICVTLLYIGFTQNIGVLNLMSFTVLPYVAVAIFIVGSIYRYRQLGFKVSSLSSQFLEGKMLFWGSQPFHWGILVLFFGHLIAFLFPSAILAWNGEPVRLLILEVSAFIFGLSALFGLVMFIIRRFGQPRLIVVSNKMDMVVYTVLLLQIISGLGVAFFVRWGSSWFASVMSPYLKSLFALNPQIDAISAMPFWIQLHIVSAFLIIAIIPFTRFMHFLVAPIDYLWRSSQVVMWNWNKGTIRTTNKHNVGQKVNNH